MTELLECIEKLSSEDEAERIYAAEDIGYQNRPEGVPPLLARLSAEPSRAAREAIFSALRQIENDSVIHGAIALLDSEDSFLRNQAVEVLRARGAKAISDLERSFREGGNDRRKFIIDIVAKLPGPEASAIYELALADPDSNVVITAVESIGACGNTAFRERIESLVTAATHPMLLCACLEALAQMGEPGSVPSLRSRMGDHPVPGYLLPSWLKFLGANGSPEDAAEIAGFLQVPAVEEFALNALTNLRARFPGLRLPPGAADSLRRIAESGRSTPVSYRSVRLMAALLEHREVFEFVSACLNGKEKAIRIAAAQALRETGSPAALAALAERRAIESDAEVLQTLAN
jgi:HEAT repeat protein